MFTHSTYGMWIFRWTFYPQSPKVEPWVFRWTFPPPSFLSFLSFFSFTPVTLQATPGSPVTPISSYSFSFYFLQHFCPENCPLLSGELSPDSRQSSDSYLLLFLLTTSFLWKQVLTGLYSLGILYQLYKLHNPVTHQIIVWIIPKQ